MLHNPSVLGLDHPGAVPDDFVPGGPGDDPLLGTPGDDTIDGAAGADTMTGLGGADTYIVDNTGDVVVEAFNQGIDTVLASVSYTLAANVEHLTLTGVDAISATGNGLANRLSGNDGANTLTGLGGNDTLDGGLGDDTLLGGTGNDTYVVDSVLDVVTEVANAGVDLIQSSVSWTLGTAQDNLTLTGATGTEALNGTGNALANTLRGNAGANTLNGLSGADSMFGGAGADIYVVDNAGDAVTEFGGNGVDLVRSSLSYTLGANVENLTLTGSVGLSGTGNTLNNNLIGNSGANTLDGGAGNDTLDGGTGNDTLTGGVGNDTYVANVVTDVVIEAAGAGTDTLRAAFSTTLAADLENLTLTGTANLNGTGNAQANVINGNAGSNTLAGLDGNDTINAGAGTGIDTVTGGIGDDVITATQGFVNGEAGTDTVSVASITASLVGTDTRWLIGGAALDVDASKASIQARLASFSGDLLLQSTNAGGGFVTQVDLDNFESLNVLQGSTSDDLLFQLGSGTVYNAGAGTDTFYADLAGRSDDIDFTASGGGGLTISSVERLLLNTGSGDDNIDMRPFLATSDVDLGAGNDSAIATVGTLDMGADTDTVDITAITASLVGTTTRWLIGGAAFDAGTTKTVLQSRLASFSDDLVLQSTNAGGGFVNQLDLENAESLNILQGSSSDDLLFQLGSGGTYNAGAGTDTFYADFSARTGNITFNASGGGGVSISSVERLLLFTGSGNDTVDMRPFLPTSDVDTGLGNDSAFITAGTLDMGAGTDSVELTSITASLVGNTTRWLIGGAAFDATTSAAGLRARLASFSGDLVLQSTNLGGGFVAQVDLEGVENLNVLQGSASDDLLFQLGTGSTYAGGAGNDTFFGDFGTRSDNITFGATGGGGVSISSVERLLLYTGSGNDTVNMTPFATTSEVFTGVGNDTVTVTGGTLDTGDGTDAVTINSITASVTGTLTRWLIGGAAFDANATASSLKTRLASFSGDLVLQGTNAGGGFITQLNLDGAESLNVLQGSSSNDLLFQLGSGTRYDGGAGTDTYYADWGTAANNIVWVNNPAAATQVVNGVTVSSMERLLVSTGSGNDRIDNSGPNTLATNDQIDTGAGNDTLNGGAGTDTMTGGSGNDSYTVDATTDQIVEVAAGGTDSVSASATYTLSAEVDNLTLTGSADLNATGNAGNNALNGNSGNNALSAGSGDDTLTGGAGNDSLTGSSGFDTFVLNSLVGSDTVIDFASGTDDLLVSQGPLRVGDGDALVEGAVTIAGPGGFGTGAELVVVTNNIIGALSTAAAAAAIGSAATAYTVGQTALFVVDNGGSAGLYYFTSADANATVSAAELTLLATVQNTASVTTGDILFGP